MTQSRGILPFRARRMWGADEDALLRELYPHVETIVVAWFLFRSVYMVQNRAHAQGIKKTRIMIAETARERTAQPNHGSHKTRFQKGLTPPNKGRKGYYAPGSEKGWFKKGHQRNDTAAVGAERIDSKDGYILVKVAEKGDQQTAWRLKHRLVWQAAHGPIPRGHTVILIDGDKRNTALSNLELITRRELMARNTVHNLPKPVAQVVQLLGALRRKINARTGKQQRHHQTAGAPVRHADSVEGQRETDGP